MSYEGQATFGDVTIRDAKTGETCKKVMHVSDGERTFCGNSAKFVVVNGKGESEGRCGIHKSDFTPLLAVNDD